MTEKDQLMERMQQMIAALRARPGDWFSRAQLAKNFGRRQLGTVDLMALALLEERGQIEVKRIPDQRPAGVVFKYRVKPAEAGKTKETTVFYIGVKPGKPGKPLKLDNMPDSPTQEQLVKRDLSYWALSANATSDYPSVLIHIYYTGPVLSEKARDDVNAAVKDYVGKLLAEGK